MWFLHSLCMVLYITVIICICTIPMARSHFLEVPENSLEIPHHGTCNSPVQSFCGKASDQVERPKECVNRWSSPYRGAQSPFIYYCAYQWLGNTLVFSAIKFQMCGKFFNAYSGQFPVDLITKYNYICYFVNFLSMLVILLYLSSQVCLKLVHWIYKCMQGQGTFGKVARLVLTYITTKCYFVKLLLLHDIV